MENGNWNSKDDKRKANNEIEHGNSKTVLHLTPATAVNMLKASILVWPLVLVVSLLMVQMAFYIRKFENYHQANPCLLSTHSAANPCAFSKWHLWPIGASYTQLAHSQSDTNFSQNEFWKEWFDSLFWNHKKVILLDRYSLNSYVKYLNI